VIDRSERILLEEKLTRSVIGGFYVVHRALGFGFLEQVYANAWQCTTVESRSRISDSTW